GGRSDQGVPLVGLAPYFGPVPTVLVGGSQVLATLPLVAGIGVPWSPLGWLTVAASGEVAPAIDIDTVFKASQIEIEAGETDYVDLDEEEVADLVADAVELELGFSAAWRAGLNVEARLGRAALDLRGGVGSLGSGDASQLVWSAGAGLVMQWDRVVPAVLPNQGCRMCP
ncbi:MAG: hypothetical protein GY884_10665, partial [Proteobacteria bacterium]|nr:hypothetical protein [Pseudomonadota bacterium]